MFILWKECLITRFAFLTFEVGYIAKSNSAFILLEPVKVGEMADCQKSICKLIGEKCWSFYKKKKSVLFVFISAKQAHITTDTYRAIRYALW